MKQKNDTVVISYIFMIFLVFTNETMHCTVGGVFLIVLFNLLSHTFSAHGTLNNIFILCFISIFLHIER